MRSPRRRRDRGVDPRRRARRRRYFELPIEDDQQQLTITMEDYDLTGNDFMGEVRVDMDSLSDRETRRMWLELKDKDNQKAGDLEVALRWAHDPKLVLALSDRFTEPETPECLEKEANELLVCLIRGKNLPIMDKNLMSKGGSSDPVATLFLDGEVRKSNVVPKNLNPQWLEDFAFPCDDGLDLPLDVTIEDHDKIGKNDFMGQCGAHLASLLDLEERKVERVWFPLAPEGVPTQRKGGSKPSAAASRGSRNKKPPRRKQKAASVKTGDGPNLGRVELALRWVHNPSRVIDLPDNIIGDEPKPEEPANSLLITIVRARNLPAMDSGGLFGGKGSSDPFVKIEVQEEQTSSTVKKRDLNPIWVESFELPCAEKDATAVIHVLDYDARNAPEPIGRFTLPFSALADRKLMRRWFGLRDANAKKIPGKVEAAFKWHHNADFSITLPRDMEGADDTLDMPPNQLRICLMRARERPARAGETVSRASDRDGLGPRAQVAGHGQERQDGRLVGPARAPGENSF